MLIPRRYALTLGPLVLVSLCYAVAAPSLPVAPLAAESPKAVAPPLTDNLLSQCETLARELQLPAGVTWHRRLRPPYVMISDLPDAQLNALYEQTILPTQRALNIDYFDHPPDRPVTLFILSTDQLFRRTVDHFGFRRQAEYSGLYAREQRTILINLSTGYGTVAHELTHALAHADFPDMPEWLDEGLASLHEDARFSSDQSHILGEDNWRMRFLREADERDCWKSVSALWRDRFAEPDIAALDYALARNFCLYLQQQGLLTAYYRKCRAGASAERALREVLPGKSPEEFEREFRAWTRNSSAAVEINPAR